MLDWYAAAARDLPWRRDDTSPWGIFVSEVMLQQTPVARVEPVWRDWLARWPMPAALAAAAPGDAVRQWGRLGYPRRALRLHEAATSMVDRHCGEVPSRIEDLLSLPGVGIYTGAAVASFAFGERTAVVDTNARRVLARAVGGRAQAAPALTGSELALAASLLPPSAAEVRTWNVAVMELGALVCAARAPRCPTCPIADLCVWREAAFPAYEGPVRRTQSWHGTDRQARGALLAVLRSTEQPAGLDQLAQGWPDPVQRQRCLDGLVLDGLVQPLDGSRYRLPGG